MKQLKQTSRFLMLICLVLIQANMIIAQENDKFIIQAEDSLLNFNYTASYDLAIQTDAEYLKRLSDQTYKASYSDLSKFSQSILNRSQTNFDLLNQFMDSSLRFPDRKMKIDSEFISLSFNHISNLRNNNQLDQSASFNQSLEEYILEFDTSQNSIKKVWALTLINQLVLFQIENDTLNALKWGEKIIRIAKEAKDTSLLIKGYFHQFDTYTLIRDLEKSFYAAEECYRLDRNGKEKSNYYYENLFHLIDLYQYTEEYSKANPLLNELFSNNSTRLKSYELISRTLNFQHENEAAVDSMLMMVGVNDVFEFRDKALKESNGILFDYDLYYLYSELSALMAVYGDLLSSNQLIREGSKIRSKLYSEDLSKSLAKQKEVLIRKEKEFEIAAEQKKTTIYGYSSLIIAFFLLLVILAWIRVKNQKTTLQEKNKEIEKQKQILEKREHEKALLLKEVHHRVKNNFQIISSLLELQSKGIEDEKAKELALEGKNRVKSMALIHQKLYQNDDLLIYFDEYINKLVEEISNMYGKDGEIKVNKTVPNVAFDIDTAIPLGLIINELITNAFKYGCENGGEVKLKIEEIEEGLFSLEVKDSGKGMPHHFDFSKAKSMGLRLVRSLSKQLHGSVKYQNSNGALFQVVFKNSTARARTA